MVLTVETLWITFQDLNQQPQVALLCLDTMNLKRLGYFHNKSRTGGISAMGEKELGERNFGFDSLKSRLNSDMEEKGMLPGIVSAAGSLVALHQESGASPVAVGVQSGGSPVRGESSPGGVQSRVSPVWWESSLVGVQSRVSPVRWESSPG